MSIYPNHVNSPLDKTIKEKSSSSHKKTNYSNYYPSFNTQNIEEINLKTCSSLKLQLQDFNHDKMDFPSHQMSKILDHSLEQSIQRQYLLSEENLKTIPQYHTQNINDSILSIGAQNSHQIFEKLNEINEEIGSDIQENKM